MAKIEYKQMKIDGEYSDDDGDVSGDEVRQHVDVRELAKLGFEDVNDIRENISFIFASQNVKLISKRAERQYPNGLCVYVLYCNRCKKRKPTYQCERKYRKRSTNCPFQLKFSRKSANDQYLLQEGTYYHNHMLTTPVLDLEIITFLDKFDPFKAKPAQIKKAI